MSNNITLFCYLNLQNFKRGCNGCRNGIIILISILGIQIPKNETREDDNF